MAESTNSIKHVASPLARQTLLDSELTRPVAGGLPIRLLPWLQVVKIGGRSIMDRGRDAILPIVDEIRKLLPEHRLLILTGAGIPPVTSTGSASTSACRSARSPRLPRRRPARMAISSLRCSRRRASPTSSTPPSRTSSQSTSPPPARWRGAPFLRIITTSSRPHAFRLTGLIQAHFCSPTRSERLALRSSRTWMGVYTTDPNGPVGEKAQLLRETNAAGLAKIEGTLPLDRALLEIMANARHIGRVQVVNGLVPGRLTAALRLARRDDHPYRRAPGLSGPL